MPPKRKALAEADANQDTVARPAKKAAKATSANEKPTKAAPAKKSAKATSANEKATKAAPAKKSAKATSANEKPTKAAPATKTAKDASTAEKAAKAAPAKKATKAPSTTKKASTAKKVAEPKATKARKFKYSNAETVTEAPPLHFVNVAWSASNREPDEGNDEAEEAEGDPKVGDILTDDMVKRVSKMGYPVTTDGIEKFEWMIQEQEKRDQDVHDMYIYNDFSGYGCTEMLEKMLKEFNKILFKKDVSPFKKWAYIEGLATFLQVAELGPWMMNDDSDGMCDVIDMFGTMVLTSFAMLAEHSLLDASSPLPNIGILALLMIGFAHNVAGDLDIAWAHEVVRALDKAGLELKPRKEVGVSAATIEELRERYREKEEEAVEEDGKNIYEVMAAMKSGWAPEDDFEDGKRIWARWDWKKEYAEFKEDHPGGEHYNLEKWSKSEKAEYTFGTAENERKMETMWDSD